VIQIKQEKNGWIAMWQYVEKRNVCRILAVKSEEKEHFKDQGVGYITKLKWS